MILGLFLDRFGIVLGSFWNRFGIVLGSFWNRLGTVLGSFCGRRTLFGKGVRGLWGVDATLNPLWNGRIISQKRFMG